MSGLVGLRSDLKAVDRDRYLASLLLPEAMQADIVALYLFNAELAVVRDRVREPVAGEIRLQWWREVISGERNDEAEGHPFARLVRDVIVRHHLPVSAFDRMLETREFELYDDPMPDKGAYEAYAGGTASALIQLTTLILDPANSSAYAEAAGHAGVAQSVAGHLMLLPIHTARGQIFLPGDLMAATGLDRSSLLDAASHTNQRKAAISAFVSYGRDHLTQARSALAKCPKAGRNAFVPVAIAQSVFARAEKMSDTCFVNSPQPSLLRRQWAIWRSASRGMI